MLTIIRYLEAKSEVPLLSPNPPNNCADRDVGSINTDNTYEKTGATPATCGELSRGSGGDYLSNEIFYRTARIRSQIKPSVPTGHLHVPTVDTDPLVLDKGKNVAKGGEEILESFLSYAVALTIPDQIIFPDTLINSAGVTQNITISVPANYPEDVVIDAVEFATTPSAFQAVAFTPLTIARGSSGTIAVKFLPTQVRDYTDQIRLKTVSQTVLHSVELKGKGIGPAPVISGFAPMSGYAGDLITITGQNFTGATDVLIGTTLVPANFNVDNDTRISFDVPSALPVGLHLIKVITPNGSATSTTRFSKRIIRNPLPE